MPDKAEVRHWFKNVIKDAMTKKHLSHREIIVILLEILTDEMRNP